MRQSPYAVVYPPCGRLRALVEVGAAGRITGGRQRTGSPKPKELEDFFQTGLVERHGKGIRLTASGKELARISRFFLLGLSNFQRGCLAEGQTYRIGASPTFIGFFLLPLLADPRRIQSGVRFTVEPAAEEEIERRLHELTLDFGAVGRAALSRPLQVTELGEWRLRFWVPKALCKTETQAVRAFAEKRLPIAWPAAELPLAEFSLQKDYEPALTCSNFLETRAALEGGGLAGFLPDFVPLGKASNRFWEVKLPALGGCRFQYLLAWNPRLLRLNPHARRRKDGLVEALAQRLAEASGAIKKQLKKGTF